MAAFAPANGDVWRSFSVLVEAAGSKDEARQLGTEGIAAQVLQESNWQGEVVVYEEEQFDSLRQLGILPLKPS